MVRFQVILLLVVLSCNFPYCQQQYYPGGQNIYSDIVAGLQRTFGIDFRRNPYNYHNHHQRYDYRQPYTMYNNRFQSQQQPQTIFEIDITDNIPKTQNQQQNTQNIPQNQAQIYEINVHSDKFESMQPQNIIYESQNMRSSANQKEQQQKVYEIEVPSDVFESIQNNPQQAQKFIYETQRRMSIPKVQPTSPKPQTAIFEYVNQKQSIPERSTTPNYEVCGESKRSVPLVSHGERASKGEWPWIVAVYKRMKLSTGKILSEFRCGATLISRMVVVTAAHCVTRANLLPFPVELFLLKLGAFNLDDETDETVVNRGVSLINVHEAHNAENKNDIAMLVMSQIVRFNFYIRPVCLWSFEKNQNLIDGQMGTVVGWGRDETGLFSDEPKMIKVPVVSVDRCRSTGAEYFPVTSRRTFCAGSRDGSGPCVGDSGGGLFLTYNNKWYLRGIVSLSVSKTKTCDLDKYIVYTDVAMYDDWIRASIT